MDRSAIILAGDSSTRFNIDKSLLELNDKTLLNHIINSVKRVVDEVIVVTNAKERSEVYKN